MTDELDQELIELSLAGDVSAFEKLVARYQDMVFSIVLKLLGNTKDAEDAAQDAFLNAYQSLSSFRGSSKFSSWLYRIAYNKGLDIIAKRKKVVSFGSISYSDSEMDVPDLENSWDTIDARKRKSIIKQSVESLPNDYGIIVTLFYYEELSLKEISRILGIEANTVKVKLHRARKKLGEVLKKALGSETIEYYGKE